jgi:hypothetical protein
MKAERGLLLAVPGDCWACFSLSFVDTMAARVVLPGDGQWGGGLRFDRVRVPDPGIPDTAINKRFDAGTF